MFCWIFYFISQSNVQNSIGCREIICIKFQDKGYVGTKMHCSRITGNKPCFVIIKSLFKLLYIARRAGSGGSMSASGSAGPGFDPQRGSKFSFENFQPQG